MASTYSTRLRLELITTGEQANTWGSTTNTNLGSLLEQSIAGYTSVNLATDADYTLTSANGAVDEARAAALRVISGVALTATRNVIVPSSSKLYSVKNSTTGGQSIVVKTVAGTGITIPNGETASVICDATNVIYAFSAIGMGLVSVAAPYVIGDIIYASGTGTFAKLAGVATGNALISGGVGTAPSWGKVGLTTHISGTLPVANGGTGLVASGAVNKLLTSNGTTFILDYPRISQNIQSTDYTLALTDEGSHVYSVNAGAQNITIPTNATVAFPIGTAITVVNNGTTAITVVSTSTTVYKAGTSAAWASGGTLAIRGLATLLKVDTDVWFISGAGLS